MINRALTRFRMQLDIRERFRGQVGTGVSVRDRSLQSFDLRCGIPQGAHRKRVFLDRRLVREGFAHELSGLRYMAH